MLLLVFRKVYICNIMSHTNIMQAEENDLVNILSLQKKSFMVVAERMNKFDLPPLLQNQDEICDEYQTGIILKYVSDDGQIVGSVRGCMDENRVCHIGKLIVHPDFQNKGIGRELMTEIERLFPHCHKFSLFTGEETPNTLHLYSKVGYNIVCRKEMEGISMIIMEKEKLTYRDFTFDDLETVCKLPRNKQELFFMFPKADFPLTINQLKNTIQDRFDSTVVLFNNEVVGFANFYEVRESQYCAIGNVIVSPCFRNRGVGTFLINAMEDIGKKKYNVSELHLSCFDANTSGLLLYTKLGYKPYEIEKYINKENEVSALIELKKVL